VRVRPATDEDWPAIWACFAPIVAAGETYTIDPAATPAEVRELWVEPPPARVFVAVRDDGTAPAAGTAPGGAVVGSAKLRPNGGGPASHVANASFVVDPARSGQGIGRALAEHVLDAARSDGYLAMQFNAVVETNVAAFALWRSLGFAVLATVPAAYRHPVRGLVGLHIMHRDL
jgi:L-amino acid N-acyltransferase YncA